MTAETTISKLALTGKLGEIRKDFLHESSGSFPVFPEQNPNGTLETATYRFYAVHYLGEALNRLKDWEEELNWDYIGLASIFGTQNLSPEEIEKYHGMTVMKRKKFIETLANSSNLEMAKITYQDQIDRVIIDPRTVALVGIADDATVPFLVERPTDKLPQYHTFQHRYLNNPDSPVKSEEIINRAQEFGAELFVLFKNEALPAGGLVGLA